MNWIPVQLYNRKGRLVTNKHTNNVWYLWHSQLDLYKRFFGVDPSPPPHHPEDADSEDASA